MVVAAAQGVEDSVLCTLDAGHIGVLLVGSEKPQVSDLRTSLGLQLALSLEQ